MKRLIPLGLLFVTLVLSPVRVHAQGNIGSCPPLGHPMTDPLDWSTVTGGCDVVGSRTQSLPDGGIIPVLPDVTEVLAQSGDLIAWWHVDTWSGPKKPSGFVCSNGPCKALLLACGNDPGDKKWMFDLATRAGGKNAVTVRFEPERVLAPWYGPGNSPIVNQRACSDVSVGHNNPMPTPISFDDFNGPVVGEYDDPICGRQVTVFDRPFKLRDTIDPKRLKLTALGPNCDRDDAIGRAAAKVQKGAPYVKPEKFFLRQNPVYLPLGYR